MDVLVPLQGDDVLFAVVGPVLLQRLFSHDCLFSLSCKDREKTGQSQSFARHRNRRRKLLDESDEEQVDERTGRAVGGESEHDDRLALGEDGSVKRDRDAALALGGDFAREGGGDAIRISIHAIELEGGLALFVKVKVPLTLAPAVAVPKDTVLSSKIHWAAFFRCSGVQEAKLPRVRAVTVMGLEALAPLMTGVAL